MKTPFNYAFTLYIILIFLTSGCATSYDKIEPQLIKYVSTDNTLEGVELKYKYDVLTKKYKKKAEKKGVRLVAIQITNSTEREFIYGENLVLAYDNGNDAIQLDTQKAIKELKQTVPTYLLYLLLTPVNLFITETNSNGFQEETNSIPIGLVLGPGLTAINVFTASGANGKLKSELSNNQLMGQKIKPGDVIIGLVALRSNNYDALKLEIIE